MTSRSARTRASHRAAVVAGAALLPLLLTGCVPGSGSGSPGAAPDQPGDNPGQPMRVTTPAPVEVPPREVPDLPGPTTGPEQPGVEQPEDAG